MREAELIIGYKKDFLDRTGKVLSINITNKWEEMCRLEGDFTTDELTYIVCKYMKWKLPDIIGPSRKAEIVEQRYFLFYILMINGMSSRQLSKKFGKERTSLTYVRRTLEHRLDSDPLLGYKMMAIITHINDKTFEYYDKLRGELV